jgi:mycothiol synthase
LPEPYTIWEYSCEADTWIDIIKQSFGEQWSAPQFRRELIESSGYKGDNIFFLSSNGFTIGTVTAFVAGEDHGYLHMLGIVPEFQGRGLGYLLGLKVLHYFKNYKKVTLMTHSDRLPAIKTYLKLGFVPDYKEYAGQDVWSKIFTELLKK